MAEQPSTWQQRWEALDEHIRLLHERIGEIDSILKNPDGTGGLPRANVLKQAVEELGKFADKHFHFFFDGFESGALQISDEFPPDFVYAQVIDRISEDVRALQQIVDQRAIYASHVNHTLDKADKLAFIALQPAVKAGLLPEGTTAITYFQRNASIRVIPYASVALVGVPLTSLHVEQDLISTSHEVGHYLYWNGEIKGTDYDQSLKDVIKANDTFNAFDYWLRKWREEIFADVYGALVGGRAIAYSMQDLLNEEAKSSFEEDDNKHPLSPLRPYIYLEVLKQRYPEEATADLINKWTAILQERGLDDSSMIKVNTQSGEKPFPVGEIKKLLLGIVNVILSFLPKPEMETSPDNPSLLKPVEGSAFDATSLKVALSSLEEGKTPVDVFAEKIEDAIGAIGNEKLNPQLNTHENWAAWAKKKNYKIDGISTNKVPYSAWILILQANGWTTSGPHLPPGDG